MLYLDYNWDLSPNSILLDKELDTDKLNWKSGDFFQVQEINGVKMFNRVDPLVQFILEGSNKNE